MNTKRTRFAVHKKAVSGDDLSAIVGISKSIAAKLHKAQIFTYAQLAALSVWEIVDATGGSDEVTVERVRRDDWVGQARRLAGLKTRAQFLLQLVLNDDRTVSSVKVTHSESGHEAEWIGWHEAQLIDFFRQQGGLSATPPPEDTSTDGNGVERASDAAPLEEAPAAAAPEVSEPEPKLRELRALLGNSDATCVVVAPECSFGVRLAFDLGQIERSAPQRLGYTTTIYANALGRGQRRLIGQREGAAEAGGTVRLEVPAQGLPTGIYRIEADVAVACSLEAARTAPPRTHRLKGTLFQVA